MNNIDQAILPNANETAYDVCGLYFKVDTGGEQAVQQVEQTMPREHQSLFDWIVQGEIVIARLREPATYGALSLAQDALQESLPPEQAETVRELRFTAPPDLAAVAFEVSTGSGGELTASDWYWPQSERPPASLFADAPVIRIGHLDTGDAAHPCLEGRLDKELSMDFTRAPGERRGNGVTMWSPFWQTANGFIDHGTATAGLIAGHPSKDGRLKMYGIVGKVAVVVPLRTASTVLLFPGDVFRTIEAINYAVDNGCKVISMSMAAVIVGPELIALEMAVRRAYENGVIVCAAAGQYAPTMVCPAAFAALGLCVSVAGSTRDRMQWPGCMWATWLVPGYVTIAAPALSMPKAKWSDGSAHDDGTTPWPENATLSESEGTSYSTAFTAGVAALWYAKNWIALQNLPKDAIVPRFRAHLAKSCDPWTQAQILGDRGPGILNPNKILDYFVSSKDDRGTSTAIALAEGGRCVEVHIADTGKSYYRVGSINLERRSISFGQSTEYDSGTRNAIALDEQGRCVEVHVGAGSYSSNLYYHVGKVDFTNRKIDWGKSTEYDSGARNAIALDEQGRCVEVHVGAGPYGDKLYYRVGTVDFKHGTIAWGESTNYDTGTASAISLDDNGNCVEVHIGAGTDKLYYQVGKVDFKHGTIAWGKSTQYDTGKVNSIALDATGRVVEVHVGADGRGRLYYRIGKVNFGDRVIQFERSTEYEAGSQNAVALNSQCWVEVHADDGNLYNTVQKWPG